MTTVGTPRRKSVPVVAEGRKRDTILKPTFNWGQRSDIKNNMYFYTENVVIYVSGHLLIFNDYENSTFECLNISPNVTKITAMAFCPVKKLVAIAETIDGQPPQITIFEIETRKKKRPLIYADSITTKYCSLTFSSNGATLFACTAEPESGIVLFAVEKMRFISATKFGVPIINVLVSPSDPTLFGCLSGSFFRVYKLLDQSFRQLAGGLSKREKDYLDGVWEEDCVYLITDNAVFCLRDLELFNVTMTPHKISTITSLGDRLILGTPAGTLLLQVPDKDLTPANGFTFEDMSLTVHSQLVEISQEGLLYDSKDHVLTSSFNIKSPIRFLQRSTTSNRLAVLTDDGVLFFKNLPGGALSLTYWRLFSQASANVTGLGVPLWKRLMFTVSDDGILLKHTLSNKSHSLLLRHQFDTDEAATISVHPTGLYVAVAFPKEVKIFNCLIDGFQLLNSFPVPASTKLKFSNGGQHLLIQNGTSILVVEFPTGTVSNVLRGHTSIVSELGWFPDDTVYSFDVSKFIVWEPMTGTRIQELELSTTALAGSVLISPDMYTKQFDTDRPPIILVLRHNFLYITATDHRVIPYSFPELATTCILLTELFIVGTDTGKVYIFDPLTGDLLGQTHLHSGAVKEFVYDIQSAELFSYGVDNSVFGMEVNGARPCVLSIDTDDKDVSRVGSSFNIKEELLSRDKLYSLIDKVVDLKRKIEDESISYNRKKNATIEQCSERKLDVEAKLKLKLERLKEQLIETKTKYESLEQDKVQEKEVAIRKHDHIVLEMKEGYEVKKKRDKNKYGQLLDEKMNLEHRFEVEKRDLMQKHKQYVSELTEQYELKLLDMQTELERLHTEKLNSKANNETRITELEEDLDKQVLKLHLEFREKFRSINLGLQDLAADNTKIRDSLKQDTQQIKQQSQVIQSLVNEEKMAKQQITALQKARVTLRREIIERRQTVSEKDARVKSLKNKIRELEKFRFVLTYKIQELRNLIAPKLSQIAKLQDMIIKRQEELSLYVQQSSRLSHKLTTAKLRLTGAENQLKGEDQLKEKAVSKLRELFGDIRVVLEQGSNARELRTSFRKLFSKYCLEEIQHAQTKTDLNRTRDCLEKEIKTLTRKKDKQKDALLSDRSRILNENAALVKEINTLRKEVHVWRRKCDKVSLSGKKHTLTKKLDKLRSTMSNIKQMTGTVSDLTLSGFGPSSVNTTNTITTAYSHNQTSLSAVSLGKTHDELDQL
ncbi:hypothetical protein PCE1_002104 [Barthelona sp. PCE]